MDCTPYIYLFIFKRKTSPTFVSCRLCSVSYQLFMGSEDWHRGLRLLSQGLKSRTLLETAWVPHTLPSALTLVLPAFLPTLPRTSLSQRLMKRE